MDDLCLLCSQPFDPPTRPALVLACSHEFCKACLLYYQTTEGGLQCKKCGQPDQRSVMYLKQREPRTQPVAVLRGPTNPFTQPAFPAASAPAQGNYLPVANSRTSYPSAAVPFPPIVPSPPIYIPPASQSAPYQPVMISPPPVTQVSQVTKAPVYDYGSQAVVHLTSPEGVSMSHSFDLDAYMWVIVPYAFDLLGSKSTSFDLLTPTGAKLEGYYLSNTKFSSCQLGNPLSLHIAYQADSRVHFKPDPPQTVQITVKMPPGEANLVRNFAANDMMWSVFEQIGKSLMHNNRSFDVSRENGKVEDIALACGKTILEFDSRPLFSISVKYSAIR